MRGDSTAGEKRTQLTQSVWQSFSSVYTHSPFTFQILSLLSRPPDRMWRLSGEKAVERTSLVWPRNLPKQVPVLRFHRRRDLSHEADSAYSALLVKATSWTKPV